MKRSLAILGLAALALAALTAGFNLILRSSLDHDANQVLTARAAATLATVEIRHGVLHGTEAPDRNAHLRSELRGDAPDRIALARRVLVGGPCAGRQ